MNFVFYTSAVVAIVATAMVITRPNVMHALLYLVLSFLAVSIMFYTLGAPFIAILEVIVYAGAIMVLFVFAIMLLNVGPQTVDMERRWLETTSWIGPVVLALLLIAEFGFVLFSRGPHGLASGAVEPKQVGASLFTTYLIGVELASILLLTSLVGAFHLGYPVRAEHRLHQQQVMGEKGAAVEAGVPPATPGELQAMNARPGPPGSTTAAGQAKEGGE